MSLARGILLGDRPFGDDTAVVKLATPEDMAELRAGQPVGIADLSPLPGPPQSCVPGEAVYVMRGGQPCQIGYLDSVTSWAEQIDITSLGDTHMSFMPGPRHTSYTVTGF